MATTIEIAQNNMQSLSENEYPGRGIIMGQADTGDLVQVYWIMGRSPNSRNRKFVSEGRQLFTEPLDASKVVDPSLIIYRAMASVSNWNIVSNGSQTDTVFDYYNQGGQELGLALSGTSHEPDAPNYTPRITGVTNSTRRTFEFSKIVRRPDESREGEYSARFYYGYPGIEKGFGYCLHTYNSDGDPLPTFDRDPYLVRLQGYGSEIAKTYWDLLNEENRVALAVKTIKFSQFKQEIQIINAVS